MQRTDSLKSSGGAADGKPVEESNVEVTSARPSRDEDNLSLDDLFEPGKTAKENKSTLMSYELDRMGMGRYQWCVFVLCGLGFFVDLLWAQAFGLILVPLENQPDFDATRKLLSSAFRQVKTLSHNLYTLLF